MLPAIRDHAEATVTPLRCRVCDLPISTVNRATSALYVPALNVVLHVHCARTALWQTRPPTESP